MKANKFISVQRLSIAMGLALSFGNIIAINPSFSQQSIQPKIEIRFCSASITKNCINRNKNVDIEGVRRATQEEQLSDPRSVIRELPQPGPRPINGDIPSINVR